MPLRRDRGLRQQRRARLATSRVGCSWIARPSRSAAPCGRPHQPGETAQQRRLAAGVGPTTTVTCPGGIVVVRPVDDRSFRRTPSDERPRRGRTWSSCSALAGSVAERAGRAGTGAPSAPVTTPTGRVAPGTQVVATKSEASTTTRADETGRRERDAARRATAGAIGPDTNATKATGPPRRWRRRRGRRRRAAAASRARATRHAETGGRVVPERERVERPRPARIAGSSTSSETTRSGTRGQVLLLRRAAEPHEGVGREAHVGAGEEVATPTDWSIAAMPMPTRTSRARAPPPPASRWIAIATRHGAAERPAPRRPARSRRAPRSRTPHRRWPRGHADHVRAGERVAQQGLEQRAGHAEGDADQRAGHGPRQLVLEHDEGRPGEVGAGDDPDQVGEASTVKVPSCTSTRNSATTATREPGRPPDACGGSVVRRRSGRRRRLDGEVSAVTADTAARRRTSHDEHRGADQRGHQPGLHLGRAAAARDRPCRRRPAAPARAGRTAAAPSGSRAPTSARAACGHDQADEADRPATRGGRAAEQHRRPRRDEPAPRRCAAEGPRGGRPEGERR